MTDGEINADKKLRFNEVEILEFGYILGDNPAVSSGAPVAIGNDLVGKSTFALDNYELTRAKRKSRKKLALPVQTRAQILLGCGYSLESIASATMEADSISKDRLDSLSKQKWDSWNLTTERFGKVIRKAIGKKRVPEQATVVANTA